MLAWTCLGEDHCLQPRKKGWKPEERSTKIHASELSNPDTFSGDISKQAILIFQFKE